MRFVGLAVVLAATLACVDRTAPAAEAQKKIDVTGIPSQIRILVAPSGTYYHVDNGVARGVTVESAGAFEKWLDTQSSAAFDVTVIETPEDRLIADLLAGKGEIAANLLLTFERDDQVAFADPIRSGIKELVVTGPGQPPLVSLEDVGGREIHVRKTSDHYSSLLRLNEQLIKINRPPAKIVLLPAGMTDEKALEVMNAGAKVPATIVDDYIFDAWRGKFPKLNVNRDVAVSQDGKLGWVTRKDASRLIAVINQFHSSRILGP
jgi:membrane-bound lytic murein transglycosylase MltF